MDLLLVKVLTNKHAPACNYIIDKCMHRSMQILCMLTISQNNPQLECLNIDMVHCTRHVQTI